MQEKDLVEYIAKNLVDNPDDVEVVARETRSSTILELHVARGDVGRVIGKQGRVANAIRSLVRVVSADGKRRVVLEID